jgi:hypothetical protein
MKMTENKYACEYLGEDGWNSIGDPQPTAASAKKLLRDEDSLPDEIEYRIIRIVEQRKVQIQKTTRLKRVTE